MFKTRITEMFGIEYPKYRDSSLRGRVRNGKTAGTT